VQQAQSAHAIKVLRVAHGKIIDKWKVYCGNHLEIGDFMGRIIDKSSENHL
jgi:hypothetical protein